MYLVGKSKRGRVAAQPSAGGDSGQPHAHQTGVSMVAGLVSDALFSASRTVPGILLVLNT